MVAAKLANMEVGRPSEKAPIGAISDARAANMLNVGERSVERAKAVQRTGTQELQNAVETGFVPVSTAADIASAPVADSICRNSLAIFSNSSRAALSRFTS